METIKFNKKETDSKFNKALNEAIKKSVDAKNRALKTNKIVTK
jgi:hypothetical protein